MKLSRQERDRLPLSAFAIPELREYPLTDAKGKLHGPHIVAAVHYYRMHGHRLLPKYKKEFVLRVCKAHAAVFPNRFLKLCP